MAQSRIAAPVTDPRQTGWPCRGNHLRGRERSNQYGKWTTCTKCGLRLSYETKVKGHGETRSLGVTPELVTAAQEELQLIYQANEMNEKIFQGKVLEIKGRQLVTNRGQGSLKTEIRADDPRADALLAASTTTGTMPTRSTTPPATPTRSTTAPTSRRSPTTPTPMPSTPTRTTRSLSPSPSLAPSPIMVAAKAKAAPHHLRIAERDPTEIQDPQTPDWQPEMVEIHSDGSAEVVEDLPTSGVL